MTDLERHHATIFVPPEVSGPVDELRQQWDPEMHRQIAAHVTWRMFKLGRSTVRL